MKLKGRVLKGAAFLMRGEQCLNLADRHEKRAGRMATRSSGGV